jgi:hypothetical protein
MTEIRTGQDVLLNNFSVVRILSKYKNNHYSVFNNEEVFFVKEKEIFCILRGPDQPETEDVEDNYFFVPNSGYAKKKKRGKRGEELRVGTLVRFLYVYEDVEIEISGIVKSSTYADLEVVELGSSCKNRVWKVAKNNVVVLSPLEI